MFPTPNRVHRSINKNSQAESRFVLVWFVLRTEFLISVVPPVAVFRVQFSSRWYLYARKSPYALHPVSRKFPPTLLLRRLRCSSDWRWTSLVLSKKTVKRFPFPRRFPPGDRWCAVFGFVPAGCVSSSSTLRIFREASHL